MLERELFRPYVLCVYACVCVKLIALVFEIWRVWPWIGSRVARFYSSRDASMLAIF